MSEGLQPTRAQSDLLLELPSRRLLGRLTGHVAFPRGELEQVAADRGPELPNEEHGCAVVDERHHRHRPRVVHDLPLEGVAVRPGERGPRHGDERPLVAPLLAEPAEQGPRWVS